MLYVLPVIYFLMVYGAMYHVPKYIPPAKENPVKGSSLPAPVKNDVTRETPSEPGPVPNTDTTPPPVPAASELQTKPEQVPSLNTESSTKETTIEGASLPIPDNKVVNQEIPSEPIPVPNAEIAPPAVPAASEAQALPEQVPSLNTESSTKEATIEGSSLPTPDNKVVNQETPSESISVPNVEIAPPAASEAYPPEQQTPPLNVENVAPAVPAQSESSVPQQNNEPIDVPASPEKQDSAPVGVRDVPEESALPLPDPTVLE